MKARTLREPLAHGLMFWVLATMGVAAAVPCILGPPIETYRALLAIEQHEESVTQRMEDRITRQVSLKEALRTDPQVNLRLAQRQLAYRPLGRLAYLDSSGLDHPAPVVAGVMRAEPVELPRWMACFVPRSFASMYTGERTRQVVLAMSLSLIVFALVTYAPRARAGGAAIAA